MPCNYIRGNKEVVGIIENNNLIPCFGRRQAVKSFNILNFFASDYPKNLGKSLMEVELNSIKPSSLILASSLDKDVL